MSALFYGMINRKSATQYKADGSGILYTEDNIPIETIYVGNISSKVTEQELRKYFEHFGSVVSVSINRGGTKYAPYFYAFVTFTEPQSATKVLRDNMHWILGKRTKVKAADSWIQPKKDDFYKNSTENDPSEDEETNENEFSILNLNDDCLFHIASFLGLSDLLNVSKTCKRLEYVSNVTFASYKSLDTLSFGNLTLMRVREILAKVGPHIQQITCCSLNGPVQKRYVQFLPKYCSNVNSLDFTSIKCLHDSVYKKMIRTFKNLKTLKLQNCSISDDVCAVLYNCGDLETLDLSENYEITGRHLDKLTNLQTLNLKFCLNLQPMFFKALCLQTKLVSLNIERCDRLNDSAIETLANTQVKLEDLSISYTYISSNLIPLTTLKSLKRLTVRCNSNICDNFFQELATNRGAALEMLEITRINLNQNIKQAFYELKNLKELSIPKCKEIDSVFFTRMAKSAPLEYFSSVGCSSVCNEGILNLIRFSDTIKKINVSLCNQLYPELVTSAVEVLKTKKMNQPLTLLVGHTNISPVIMVEPIVLNNTHLIDLRFDYTPMFFDQYEDDEDSLSNEDFDLLSNDDFMFGDDFDYDFFDTDESDDGEGIALFYF